MKALFTYDYGKENMRRIEALGYEVIFESEKTIANKPRVDEVEVLVCYNPFHRLDVTLMKQLQFIQLSSTGIDQLPRDLPPTVKVANNRGGYSVPMGEWTVMRILEIYKDAPAFYEDQKKKEWRLNNSIQELTGKRVAFLGTGTVAAEGAKRLKAFGMVLHGFSRSGKAREDFEAVYPMDRLPDLMGDYDVLVITLPHTPLTHHLVSHDLLARLKEGAVLVNVSRGRVLDEEALLVHAPRLRGIALDVFNEEPLSQDSPLWEVPNLLFSPHNSWVSERRNSRRFELIHENLSRLMAGETPRNLVDIERGY